MLFNVHVIDINYLAVKWEWDVFKSFQMEQASAPGERLQWEAGGPPAIRAQTEAAHEDACQYPRPQEEDPIYKETSTPGEILHLQSGGGEVP